MNSLWQDLRFSARMLRKKPGSTLLVVLVLALSIGANTAIFSVVDAVLLRHLPFRDADRLVKLLESNPRRGFSRLMISLGDFAEWKKQNQSFEDISIFDHVTLRSPALPSLRRFRAIESQPIFLNSWA
jgi:putative ABC transport system permease protein